MMADLLEMIVYIVVNLLVVKMVFFRNRVESAEKASETENVTWMSAVESMDAMENRLEQLQERDSKQQERIWALEDENRDLKNRTATLTKELLLLRRVEEEAGPNFDVDDEDDFDHSIPPNN